MTTKATTTTHTSRGSGKWGLGVLDIDGCVGFHRSLNGATRTATAERRQRRKRKNRATNLWAKESLCFPGREKSSRKIRHKTTDCSSSRFSCTQSVVAPASPSDFAMEYSHASYHYRTSGCPPRLTIYALVISLSPRPVDLRFCAGCQQQWITLVQLSLLHASMHDYRPRHFHIEVLISPSGKQRLPHKLSSPRRAKAAERQMLRA